MLIGAVVAIGALAACDTGDGKTLTPYDPADYPSQTAAPTSIAGDDSALDDLGDLGAGEQSPPTDFAADGDAAAIEPFQVFAPWVSGAEIDARNTCDGDDIAPALSWGALPTGTAEIAIALVDDSAVSDGKPFVHWVIAGLDPAEIALVEGDVPAGAVQALNYFGDVGYGGPCPPPGDDPHLYRLTAYALNQPVGVADGSGADEFLDAIARFSIGSADLSGTYQR
jgi:Raf kinase inhibitor-like YbhB/YbcL family protein